MVYISFSVSYLVMTTAAGMLKDEFKCFPKEICHYLKEKRSGHSQEALRNTTKTHIHNKDTQNDTRLVCHCCIIFPGDDTLSYQPAFIGTFT